MVADCDMAALKAEAVTLTITVGIMHDKLANRMDPTIAQYDEMLASFATLCRSWKETVQKHIVAADEKQKVADYKFDNLNAKASTSISEVSSKLAATDAPHCRLL